MKIIIFSLFCLFSFNLHALSPDYYYKKGKIYDDGDWNEQNFNLLLLNYTTAANLGHIQANVRLGHFYRYKRIDKVKEAYWLTQAAKLGDADSQFDVAYFYLYGDGVTQDREKALDWFFKAAKQGHVGTQHLLGNFYSHKFKQWGFMPLDYTKAIYWYTEAAYNGDNVAQSYLADMYLKGKGTPVNLKKAFRWFRKSAESGNELTQYKLGLMYQNGEGVIPSNIHAYAWFALSALNGVEDGLKSRDMIAKKLTPSGLEKAQSLAVEFSESRFH